MHVIISITNCGTCTASIEKKEHSGHARHHIYHELRHLRGLAAARLARDHYNTIRLEPSGVSISTHVLVKQAH